MTNDFVLLNQPLSPLAPRVGQLTTTHGKILTPAFNPVATQATVKAISSAELEDLGVSTIIANSYHLLMRPGIDLIEELGGIHSFMSWMHPIATDSGGFQIFSLGHMLQVDDDRLTFKSHIDGSLHSLTPEEAIQNQERLGVDLMMSLDQCVPFTNEIEAVQMGVRRTTLWARRCREAWSGKAMLFGIIQGGVFPEEREKSAKELVAMDFPGYAIGGLSVGEPKQSMYATLDSSCELLPINKPRHLLGVGSPEDLLEAIARGVDLFDSALPTRIARNGSLFTPEGRINILNARFKNQSGPIYPGCDCVTCTNYSTSYLHHLFKTQELLSLRLASIHNLRFILRLLEEVRVAIRANEFNAYKEAFLQTYKPTDEQTRIAQKAKWASARRG
ncbi:MAG: tRNA guanosine(34) transglycosylase Tgt [SAR202 cluster bacterium]|nr:tRNA guanosine(34) transglycosylase Tgt [SAR202 cluster bacterium]|tara:strand:+ start:11110 stop:12276 length:1167 start_codon:yes stop_codon:yes gene_type:complete